MSEPPPDDELSALFARQRAADHQSAPAFHAMRRRAMETGAAASRSGSPLAWRWVLPAATALAVGIAVLVSALHPTPPSAPRHDTLAHQLDEIDAVLQRSLTAQHELTAWQSPTDFLLHTHYNIANRP
jgi:hypothetical protein